MKLLEVYKEKVLGAIKGLDRIRFRGTLRWLSSERLQSWVPFGVTLCLNGRHWLEKQLTSAGIGFAKEGNCFPWIEDIEEAQKLLDQQLSSNWPVLLNSLLCNTCPELPRLLSPWEFKYYWSAEETEWATDIMFSSDFPLKEFYPGLLRHAMIVSDSPAVMRYPGRGELDVSQNRRGAPPENIISDCRRRHEGMRVKHWRNNNSIKVYNTKLRSS